CPRPKRLSMAPSSRAMAHRPLTIIPAAPLEGATAPEAPAARPAPIGKLYLPGSVARNPRFAKKRRRTRGIAADRQHDRCADFLIGVKHFFPQPRRRRPHPASSSQILLPSFPRSLSPRRRGAGIHGCRKRGGGMDSRFRGNEGRKNLV